MKKGRAGLKNLRKTAIGNPIRIGLKINSLLKNYIPQEERMEMRMKEVKEWLIENAQIV
jgi:hypothetical protein